jgi:uncharacterized Ntn-hydrolase superfamily protein
MSYRGRCLVAACLILAPCLCQATVQKKGKATARHHAAPSTTSKAHKPAAGARAGKAGASRRTSARRRTTRKPEQHWVRQAPTPDRYREIQQALSDKGYFKGPVNGQWGADSVAALRTFQQEHNLDGDGKLTSLSLIGLGLGPNRAAIAKTETGEKQ